ncbi:hypothetical protein GJ496_009529 [Pomphorhynchus laevis]|nr:hypothetical protein GJ496_009529 [Pomphorhynchus laevis]
MKSAAIIGLTVSDKLLFVLSTNQTLYQFSIAGRRLYQISLSGQPLSMTSINNTVAIPAKLSHENIICNFISMSKEAISIPMPITIDCELQWIGFAEDENSFYYLDTAGYLRTFDCNFNCIIVQNVNSGLQSYSSHWITGVSQRDLTITAILCRNNVKYPEILVPRPMMTTIKFTFGAELFDANSIEALEHELLLNQFLHARTVIDRSHLSQTLIKLFMGYCKNELDYRAIELIDDLQSLNCLQVAHKCAHRLRRHQVEAKIVTALNKGHHSSLYSTPERTPRKQRVKENQSDSKLSLSDIYDKEETEDTDAIIQRHFPKVQKTSESNFTPSMSSIIQQKQQSKNIFSTLESSLD